MFHHGNTRPRPRIPVRSQSVKPLFKATTLSPTPHTANRSPTVESVVATVRLLWDAAENAPAVEQANLKREIAETVNGLKRRLDGRLVKRTTGPANDRLPFDERGDGIPADPESYHACPPRFPDPVLRVYAKDFADHALQHLPQAAKYHSVDDFRKYLADRLRFNSQATRRRSANYIVSRFFPGEVFNSDLPPFAAATAGTPALGEALWYLTCRTERIVSLVAEEVVFPSLVQGGVSRNRLCDYVKSKFPHSKSADDIGQAIDEVA